MKKVEKQKIAKFRAFMKVWSLPAPDEKVEALDDADLEFEGEEPAADDVDDLAKTLRREPKQPARDTISDAETKIYEGGPAAPAAQGVKLPPPPRTARPMPSRPAPAMPVLPPPPAPVKPAKAAAPAADDALLDGAKTRVMPAVKTGNVAPAVMQVPAMFSVGKPSGRAPPAGAQADPSAQPEELSRHQAVTEKFKDWYKHNKKANASEIAAKIIELALIELKGEFGRIIVESEGFGDDAVEALMYSHFANTVAGLAAYFASLPPSASGKSSVDARQAAEEAKIIGALDAVLSRPEPR